MNIPNFNNKQLCEHVFIHRSYINEAGKKIQSNERLEFLGDSILSFIVSSYIYEKYPNLKEGELTNLRSALTNTEILSKFSSELNLGKYLKLSKGEEETGGKTNKTILANTYEALVGGLFLDQGIDNTREFVINTILELAGDIMESEELKDPKSKLQETLQAKHKISPLYKTIKEEGPDHAKIYTVGVYFNDKLLGQGTGHSKQEAEKQAAKSALETV